MGRELVSQLGEEDPMVVQGDVEFEECMPRKTSYWDRIDDLGQSRYERPTTSILPDPEGRSPTVLNRILVENTGKITEHLTDTPYARIETNGPPDGMGRTCTLEIRLPFDSLSEERMRSCSTDLKHCFENIISRYHEECMLIVFYFAIDEILQMHSRAHRIDLDTAGADMTPTDRALVEMYAEEHAPVPEPTPKDIREFAESYEPNEGSESSDNSPPEEHIVDIQQDASDIDDDADFETKMYQVATQTEDNDHIAEVIEYNPDMDDESVAITLRLPDQSIGTLEYDIPDTESTDDSSFVAMIDAARATRLHKPEESDGFVETKQPIELESIERLKNGEIPVKEHKDSWVVDTNSSLPIDIDESRFDTSESTGFSIPTVLVEDIRSVGEWLIPGVKFLFWVFCAPALFFLYPGDPHDTAGEFMYDVEGSLWKITTAFLMSTLTYILAYGVLF